MRKKLDHSKRVGNDAITILYPGVYLSSGDTGYHSIGRIDQAHIGAGVVIKMHPHANDDILSYFRSGKVRHTDSEGFEALITPTKLMLMKAGKLFYHEEAVDEAVEGLQIFIRPAVQDAVPEVTFADFPAEHSLNKWRLLASPNKEQATLVLSSQTFIYDAKLTMGHKLILPEQQTMDLVYILYLFRGEATVSGEIELSKGEAVIIEREQIEITTTSTAELVLFATDPKAAYYDGGMYSGRR